MPTEKPTFSDFVRWSLAVCSSGLKIIWYKLYKRKVTVSQFAEGLLFIGNTQSERLFKKIIENESLSDETRSELEWEIFFFTFALVYILIGLMSSVNRKSEIVSRYLELYQNTMNESFSENAKSLYKELLKRIKLYEIAWRIGETKSIAKLLLNLLFMIRTGSNRGDFIKGYIRHAESPDKNISEYYTRSWFPSAHGLTLILETFNDLASSINFQVKHFSLTG